MKLFKGLGDFLALKGFRDFILRGNLVDLAVAFVIGAAFATLVQAFVKDLITPLIAIPGSFSFPNWTVSINHSDFHIGDFVNTLISFILMALVLFFFVVRPMTALLDRIKRHEKQPEPDKRECPFCLNEIPIKATRCGFCTSDVAPPGAAPATAPAAPGAREPVS